jgi:hypothetical protein
VPGTPLDLDSEWSTSRSVRMKSNNTWRGETNLRIPDAGVYSYSTPMEDGGINRCTSSGRSVGMEGISHLCRPCFCKRIYKIVYHIRTGFFGLWTALLLSLVFLSYKTRILWPLVRSTSLPSENVFRSAHLVPTKSRTEAEGVALYFMLTTMSVQHI